MKTQEKARGNNTGETQEELTDTTWSTQAKYTQR